MPIVGDVLAERYRIDAPIGVGGMASVYRAADLRLERDVAVKVLLPNLAADPALAQRFEREALALAATSHPSVVKVFDVEPGDPTTGREPFYVMELCDGGSLADRLRTRARLEPDEVVDVIGAVAAGLADLHARGFVHRDVKPHNILFDHERARLADFGLARSEEASELTSLTASGATVGTLAYIAPELLRGDPATPASDVYALGVVAFQGLTGRLPRPATAVAELVAVARRAGTHGVIDRPGARHGVRRADRRRPRDRPDGATGAGGAGRWIGGGVGRHRRTRGCPCGGDPRGGGGVDRPERPRRRHRHRHSPGVAG